MEWRPTRTALAPHAEVQEARIERMAVCDDPIKPNFVKIRRFELEHDMNCFSANFVRDMFDLGTRSWRPSKSRSNDLFAVGIQEIESLRVRTR